MYLQDLGQNVIDLACDEAIFRRTKTYNDRNLTCRFILGQWHTSEAMAGALITAFSGYGFYNIATALGVRFLEALEKNVDYRATSCVLELIWVAVGISINQYVLKLMRNNVRCGKQSLGKTKPTKVGF